MQSVNVIFFGSTTDSVVILNRLYQLSTTNYPLTLSAVVTQPPRPIGRKQIITPTPVETWAKEHQIPVLSFPCDGKHPNLYENEQTVIDSLQPFKADILVSASYGQKIPTATIAAAKYGGLNVHPSLLPRWRGADPVPWAILSGDHQTGVTVVTLAEEFDAGVIIAQKKLPITPQDFSDPLRTKLFEIGANLLVVSLPAYIQSPKKHEIAAPSERSRNDITTYARRFTRQDGFEPWENIQKAFEDPAEAARIDRKFRALMPWPGIWSEVSVTSDKKQETRKTKKRLKILACHLSPVSCLSLDTVQLEGKTPVMFEQLRTSYQI